VEYSAFVLDAPLKQNGFGLDVPWCVTRDIFFL
jgi:hypothetical protein